MAYDAARVARALLQEDRLDAGLEELVVERLRVGAAHRAKQRDASQCLEHLLSLEAVDESYRQQTNVPLAGLVLVADLVELFPFDAHAHVAGEIVADACA